MGPEEEKDERPARKVPEDVQDEGRTLARNERPVMEDLGRGEADTEEHSG